jgi:hypothetical protein
MHKIAVPVSATVAADTVGDAAWSVLIPYQGVITTAGGFPLWLLYSRHLPHYRHETDQPQG